MFSLAEFKKYLEVTAFDPNRLSPYIYVTRRPDGSKDYDPGGKRNQYPTE